MEPYIGRKLATGEQYNNDPKPEQHAHPYAQGEDIYLAQAARNDLMIELGERRQQTLA